MEGRGAEWVRTAKKRVEMKCSCIVMVGKSVVSGAVRSVEWVMGMM